MQRHLVFCVIGALVALAGGGALVKHFVHPGNLPEVGGVPFWICVGAVLILGGIWFALKGQMDRLRAAGKRMEEERLARSRRGRPGKWDWAKELEEKKKGEGDSPGDEGKDS
jgi:hypothetical protein